MSLVKLLVYILVFMFLRRLFLVFRAIYRLKKSGNIHFSHTDFNQNQRSQNPKKSNDSDAIEADFEVIKEELKS